MYIIYKRKMDGLELLFGKRRRRSPRRSPKRASSAGHIMVKGRKRKLYKGKGGGMYYRTRSGKAYVSKRRASGGSGRRRRRSPKRRRRRRSPVRRRRRRGSSRRRRRRSPKRRRRRRSPKRRRRTRYGYGLGQPSLSDMMGPAGLSAGFGGPSYFGEF